MSGTRPKALPGEPTLCQTAPTPVPPRARSAALSLAALAVVIGPVGVAAASAPAHVKAAKSSGHFKTIATYKTAKFEMCLDGITVQFRMDARKSPIDGSYKVDVKSPDGTHYGHEEAWYEHSKGKVKSAGGYGDPSTVVKVKLSNLSGPVRVEKKVTLSAIPAC